MKYQKSKSIKNQKKQWILVVIAILAVTGFTLLILELMGTTDFYGSTSPKPEAPQTEETINYDPPTLEEANVGNQQKENIVDEKITQETPPTTAEVVIVDANQYGDVIEVRAFAANVIKNGTCKYTFTLNDQTLVRQTSAVPDASTTPCVNLEVPRTDFPLVGTWDLSVIFETSGVTGSAQTKVVID